MNNIAAHFDRVDIVLRAPVVIFPGINCRGCGKPHAAYLLSKIGYCDACAKEVSM